MKRLLAAAAALVVVCGLAMGQDAPNITFEKGLATCTFAVPMDQAWSAAIKTFMTQKVGKGGHWEGSPVKPDKPSNTMNGTWVVGKGLTQWSAEVSLLFEADGPGTKIYCTVSAEGPLGKKNREKVQTRFFAALAETLK